MKIDRQRLLPKRRSPVKIASWLRIPILLISYNPIEINSQVSPIVVDSKVLPPCVMEAESHFDSFDAEFRERIVKDLRNSVVATVDLALKGKKVRLFERVQFERPELLHKQSGYYVRVSFRALNFEENHERVCRD